MTDEPAPTTKLQHRGTGFPGMPLSEAVAVIQAAGKYGRSHTDAAFAGYLGHKSANSGPFRSKMAALRDWGLIERPKDGQVPLTNLGHEIAHPTGDEGELLQRAFFNAKPFATIYNESAKGTELSLALIANRAVTGLGVSAPNKDRFAESFRRSVIAAKLGRDGGDGSIMLTPPGAESHGDDLGEAQVEGDASDATPASIPPTPTATQVRSATERPPTIHQEWAVAGGHVVFEVNLDGPLPGSTFAEIGAVITAVETLVASLQPIKSAASQPVREAEPKDDDLVTD